MFTFPVGFFAGQNAPYWDNVVLYLPMTGANGSTTFTDVSKHGHTVTRNGGAIISTAQAPPLTGVGSSGYFDGSGDWLTCPGTSEFSFGTSDFTIEMFARLSSASTMVLLDFRPFGNGFLFPIFYIDGRVLKYFTNNSLRITGTTILSLSTWYYLALVRNSGVTRIYLNGVQEGGDFSDNLDYAVGLNRPVIGADAPSLNVNFFNGFLSHIRIAKGVALDVSVVPTAPFPIG